MTFYTFSVIVSFMNHIFHIDNPFFRFMGNVADLVILNFLFLICCIPIVTIGASFTAAYYVALKKVRGEESYIARSFFHSFKQNFRQSTIIWLIFLFLGILLSFDFQIINTLEGSVSVILNYLMIVAVLFSIMIFLYVFPVLARFYNPIKITLKNALLMAVRHLPYTILMFGITAGFIFITFLNYTSLAYGLLIWIVIGFALIIFINSYFFRKVFDYYTPSEEQAPKKSELSCESSDMNKDR